MPIKVKPCNPSGSSIRAFFPSSSNPVEISGHRSYVQIISTETDLLFPTSVRSALVGTQICTVFRGDQVETTGLRKNLDRDARLVYLADLAEELNEHGNQEQAQVIYKMLQSAYDLFVLPPGTFKIIVENAAQFVPTSD